MRKDSFTKNSGLPKLLRWSHALRSDQFIYVDSYITHTMSNLQKIENSTNNVRFSVLTECLAFKNIVVYYFVLH